MVGGLYILISVLCLAVTAHGQHLAARGPVVSLYTDPANCSPAVPPAVNAATGLAAGGSLVPSCSQIHPGIIIIGGNGPQCRDDNTFLVALFGSREQNNEFANFVPFAGRAGHFRACIDNYSPSPPLDPLVAELVLNGTTVITSCSLPPEGPGQTRVCCAAPPVEYGTSIPAGSTLAARFNRSRDNPCFQAGWSAVFRIY